MRKRQPKTLILSKDEFKKKYIDPAMKSLANDYLYHPERLAALDRKILRSLGYQC